MILVTAATPWEAKPLARRWDLSPAGADGREFAGKVGERELRLIQTGMGRERSLAALRSMEERGTAAPRLVVSAGFAGALQEGLRPGDLVADLRGAPLEWVQSARESASRLKLPLYLGNFHVADRVLGPQEKRAIGQERRALAVDLETAAVREWCERRGAAFAGVRAIFDSLSERAPEEAPADDRAASMLRFAVRHWRQTPRLVSYLPRQARGLSALGRFLQLWFTTI